MCTLIDDDYPRPENAGEIGLQLHRLPKAEMKSNAQSGGSRFLKANSLDHGWNLGFTIYGLYL